MPAASSALSVADPRSTLARRFERDVIPLRNRLYCGAVRLTGNTQDAEDLVQDTILYAYAGFPGFRDGTNLTAWLYRIMHNLWISNWRKKQRRVAEVSVDKINDDQLSVLHARDTNDCCSAEFATLASFPDAEVRTALMALCDAFRLTVYYADVEGFSNKEIAHMMNAPIGTVMSRLYRARRQLRDSLLPVAGQRGYRSVPDRDEPARVVP